MNKPNTTCRVCGKEYFCCSGRQKLNSWKTMACSEDCFKEYMRRIEESRSPKKEIKNTETGRKSTKLKSIKTNDTKESVNATESIIED